MTVEELEIIVTAKVEEALKEFEKVAPTVKKMVQDVQNAMQNVQNAMQNVNTDIVKNKVAKAVQIIKNRIDSLKKSSKDNKIKIDINNKEAQKQITQLEKEIDSLQKKITASRLNLDIISPKLDTIYNNTVKAVTPDGMDTDSPAMQKTINVSLGSNKEYQSLYAQETKLIENIKIYNEQLSQAKFKLSELESGIQDSSTSQNKLTGFFSAFKQRIEQTKVSVANMKGSFKSLPKITQNITNNIKGIGKNMKNGIGQVLKYAGALVSLRSIYSTLSGCAQSWLSSQNKDAKQLSANIEYMKYAMGSAFAPVIQYVTNLVYQLLKAIQSLVYAFSGVNIFAKATASSMKSASGSASKTSKSLAGVHSEINNVSENNSGSSGNTTPNIDMTSIDSNITDFMQRVKNKTMQLFQPIKESWDVYGKPLIESAKNAFDGVKSLVESIGQSLQEVWLNGTGTETINLLLQGWTSIFNIIGNIGQAFSIAWQNGNVGTSVVQSLWNSFNNLYSILIGAYQTFEKWTASKSFQTFADSIMGICKTLSGWFEQITIKLKEIWENGGKETFTKLLEFISKLTEAVDAVLKFLDPVIQWVLDVVTPVIQGIIEVIGYVIDALSGVLDFIIGVFTGDWNRAWQGIKDFFSGIWNAIKTVVSTVFNAIKTVITTILNSIKSVWNNIWNGIKTTVVNIWNGIWSGIKSVINKILGGIESFVNGIIKGINKLLSGISNVASAVGSIFGIKPVSLQLSTMSLPRLAKGNVAYSETVAVFGEYSGARNNPEITAPQNVLRETFSDVLAEHEYGKSQDTGMFKQLIIQFGSMQVAVEIDKLIQQARRQNGTAKIQI